MADARLLVTGFPGFIGRRLVRALADADTGARITCLVEARMEDDARRAAAEIDPERVEVLSGDITDRRLGLADDDYERLAAEATAVHHLAALYDLAVPLEVAQRVNVDGTGNVLELCLRCERLERFVYVSTAYVAGTRRGVVYEHELALGQGFKNHYESTKFQAEVWVRQYTDRIPTTIIRPAIVVGDSATGETQKFDGPFYMLRMLQTAQRQGGPIPQIGRSRAPFNVVPVDFVIDAMRAAEGDPEAAGRTLHLVDPDPISSREVLTLLAREYAGREPSVRVPSKLVETSVKLGPVRRMYGGVPSESLRYLNHPVRFDTRQAGDLLARHGLGCPRFEEYVGPMVRFFRQHEDDPAYVSDPRRLRG
ncbi:MAG TPA: SDR family oxidoreductase [Solirubrobacteraceae bacterium]|nr:SDR family oxidoreductase [Solirubrobacteraceae bacterium]